jgi:3-hydroxyisobutyrate dehydrogenase-like beta-hydroxyacid dehydrogenase
MKSPAIGFIGFGEAASHIAAGLRAAGVESVLAFDINATSPTLGARIQQRSKDTNTPLVGSPAELAPADILISAVTAGAAVEAAQQMLPVLKPSHIYLDINSISPNTKREIDSRIRGAGAAFVEAAVMAPVPPYGHRVPMLLGGAGAKRLSAILSPFGMRFEVVSEEVGAAIAVKMCRSIVVKGLEALLFECVMAANRFGAEERVLASLQESFPGIDWKKLTDYVVGRVVVHGERRAEEMREVVETLRSSGVNPTMADATASFQDWASQLNLKSHFGPEGPHGFAEVLRLITYKTKG